MRWQALLWGMLNVGVDIEDIRGHDSRQRDAPMSSWFERVREGMREVT